MDALDALLKNLADDEQTLSIARLYTLSGLDRADLDRVRAAWPSIPGERREAIVRHLVDIIESNFEVDFAPVFRIGLTDAEPGVRVAAIEGLWEEADTKLLPTLIDLLQNDAAETVRAAAASTLGHFVLAGELEEIPAAKLDQVVEALREVIEDDSETLEVRRRAVEAIGYSSADGVSDLITQAYSDPVDLMRISAVFAMGRSADLKWADLVLLEMESPDPEMRFEAARASGELQNPGAVPALARLIDDPDDQVREASVWSLGQIGGNEPRRLLTAILDDEDSDLHEVAEAALEELEFMGDAELNLSLFDFDEDDDRAELDD
jgi:HEAT repeat protein